MELLFPSAITRKLAEQLSFYHRIILCDYVIEELRLVTERKFPAKIGSLNQFFIELPFEMVYIPRKLSPQELNIMRDEKDSPILTITDFLEKYSH